MSEQCHLIVITNGGPVGSAFKGDRKACEQLRDEILAAAFDPDEQDVKLFLDGGGFGFGWPCPIGAVRQMVILGEGEKLSDDVIAKCREMAHRFQDELLKQPPIAEGRKNGHD